MSNRSYESVYSIKEFTLKDIAPKYFEMDDLSTLNVGLFGMINEVMANANEDVFNAVSTYSKEIFPQESQIPENIYSYAAFYSVDTLFAEPAELKTRLIIKEEDILQYGIPNKDRLEFTIDSNMVIEVEGIPFMSDYNIVIDAKKYMGDYIMTARYDLSYNNSISNIQVPYIEAKKIIFKNEKYLALSIWVRQIERDIVEANIIDNDKINLPTVPFNYNGNLSNFEVFYKETQNSEFVQLKKRLIGSNPLREPFCFYKMKNDDEIELSFSSKESYFKPLFNSQLKIIVTTTAGDKGNFPYYKGTKINVIPQSEEFLYNNNIIMYAIPQSDSMGGTKGSTLEEIRDLVHEKRSTLSVYTNENDLQLYFNNLKHKYGTDILFIKKRDDIYERLFSSFVLLKDIQGNFYNTNTVDMILEKTDFDTIYDQTDRFMLKPGRLFSYNSIDGYDVCKISGNLSDIDLNSREEEFIYSNPFLLMISGNVVGFYLNSLDTKYVLDYRYVNSDSVAQFVCNNVEVRRNAAMGDKQYTMVVYVQPASDVPHDIVDAFGVETGVLKVRGAVHDAGSENGIIDFKFDSYDPTTGYYRYEANISTEDYITINNKIKLEKVICPNTGDLIDVLVPMYDSLFAIYTFYKYEEDVRNTNHHLEGISDLKGYTLTNKYVTNDKNVDFVIPLSIMRSTITYQHIGESNSDYNMRLSFVPLVDARTLNDRKTFSHFIDTLFIHNVQLTNIMDKVLNNHGIDMKLYNTFGRSKNFTVGENSEILDKVNCYIHFKIYPNINADIDLESNIRRFVKEYIEKINARGTNSMYISNLIQQLQNNFADIKYLKFIQINKYMSSVQVIENNKVDINTLSKEDKQKYVPEYLTLREKDINIEITHY